MSSSTSCRHLEHAHRDIVARSWGCEECIAQGSEWVHLRICLDCGHVGCCDSSINRHATGHYKATGHPVIASAEPGEDWGWCYADQVELPRARTRPTSAA